MKMQGHLFLQAREAAESPSKVRKKFDAPTSRAH